MFKKTIFYTNLNVIFEEFSYNYNLHYFTKFNVTNTFWLPKCKKIVLNFGFKDFNFEKKQMVLYFLFLELISNQKCVLTTSSKNLLQFKIKKGLVTGCKVTLRKKNLDFFLFTLLLSLPRLEIFKGLSLKSNSNKLNTFSTKLKNLFIFYTIEFLFKNDLVALDISFNFNTLNDFEKIFFFSFFKIPLNSV